MPRRWAAAVLLPFDRASACWMAFRSSKDKFKTPAGTSPFCVLGALSSNCSCAMLPRAAGLLLRVQPGWEVGKFYAGGVAHDDAVLHGCAQLPHVSGPGVVPYGVKGVPGKGFEFLVILPGEFFQEGGGEQGHVLPPVPEGGHLDVDHVEAEIEVFPEFALLDEFLQ